MSRREEPSCTARRQAAERIRSIFLVSRPSETPNIVAQHMCPEEGRGDSGACCRRVQEMVSRRIDVP
jgi:hypothetical protein